MSRVWLIGWHHFRQEVSKRSFLLVLLSLPLFLTLTIGLGALSVRLSDEEMVVGYVDPAHFLQDTTLAVTDEPIGSEPPRKKSLTKRNDSRYVHHLEFHHYGASYDPAADRYRNRKGQFTKG